MTSRASFRLSEIEPYEAFRGVARLRRLRLDPVERTLTATVTDKADSLVAVWDLRPGVLWLARALGRLVLLEGMVSLDGAGEVKLVEPYFDVLPEPPGEISAAC